MLKEKKLKEVIYLINRFNEYGLYPHFEGKGDGTVELVLEYIEIPSRIKFDIFGS